MRNVIPLWRSLSGYIRSGERQKSDADQTLALAEQRDQVRVPMQDEVLLLFDDEQGRRMATKAEMLNSSQNGLRVRLSHSLPVGLPVWIEHEELLTKGVVRHCREAEKGYHLGLLKIHVERRRSDRQLTQETGVLEYGSSAEGTMSCPVAIRNVSEAGIQIEVPTEVPLSSLVRLSFAGWGCLGSTCYCKSEGANYLVGLHLLGEPALNSRVVTRELSD